MLPSLLQRYDMQYPYQGVHIMGPDAEVYYAARVQEVYDGSPNLGNVFYSSPKDQPAMQPSLPERSIAFIGNALGMDALGAFLFSKAFLAIAVFLAFTWLLFIVTERPWVSLFSTMLVLEAGALLSAPWDIVMLLRPETAAFDFLRFSRAINPQWSSTFFLLEIALVALWVQKNKRIPLLLAALLSLTVVYSYVYAWTYFFATMGLLSLWYLLKRDLRRIADLSMFWMLAALVVTPYLIHLSVVTNHPLYAESSLRYGMVLRHGPAILGVWCAAFIGIALASRHLWPKTWPLLPALALGGFVALNQHLVTGHYIVPHHYNWYFVQPIASLIACAFFLTMATHLIKNKFLRIGGAIFLVLVCTSFAAFQQYTAYHAVSDSWGRMQSSAPVLRYIAKNLRAEQVVYSEDINILDLVPIYGSVDVYHATNANLTLASDSRSRFAYFFDLWLQGVTPEDALREFPTTRRWMLSSRIHAIYYREAAHDFAAIPDKEVSEHIQAYREFYALPLKNKVNQYPITAVVTTPSDTESRAWSAFLLCSKEVFAQNGYGLRMMIPAGKQDSCL